MDLQGVRHVLYLSFELHDVCGHLEPVHLWHLNVCDDEGVAHFATLFLQGCFVRADCVFAARKELKFRLLLSEVEFEDNQIEIVIVDTHDFRPAEATFFSF